MEIELNKIQNQNLRNAVGIFRNKINYALDNSEELDEASWGDEKGILITVNEAMILLESLNPMKLTRQRVICYCGSLRVAKEAFKRAEYEAVIKGEIALLPCCMFVDIEREFGKTSEYKIKADDLHKRKIDMADEVHILDVGGYIGDSTRSEIEYAESINKPVKYLSREFI